MLEKKIKMRSNKKISENQLISKEDHSSYSMEEIFDIAYGNFVKANEGNVVSRKDFRTEVWSNQLIMKNYLTDDLYKFYIGVSEENVPVVKPDLEVEESNQQLEESLKLQIGDVSYDLDMNNLENETDDISLECEKIDVEENTKKEEPNRKEEMVEDIEVVKETKKEVILSNLNVLSGSKKKEDILYIFDDQTIVQRLRVATYHAPDDSSCDNEFRNMTKDEIIELLLRVNGVIKNIPAIIKDIHTVYFNNQSTDYSSGISNERYQEILLAAIEEIRFCNRYNYGPEFDSYLQKVLHITNDELESACIPQGNGGIEPISLCIHYKDTEKHYYAKNCSYEQMEHVLLQLETLEKSGLEVSITSYFASLGITLVEQEIKRCIFTYDSYNKRFIVS